MSHSDLQKVWVIIPAAGVGKRMQSDVPKQYLTINSRTVIEHTLGCFSQHPEVAGIIVALHADDPYWNDLKLGIVFDADNPKPLYTVEGGQERCDSVQSALEYLTKVEQLSDDHWVMVHDAARPCLQKNDIDALLILRDDTDCAGGILASPVRDTMKRTVAKSLRVDVTVPRQDLWHALTPQLFHLGDLSQALQFCFEKGLAVTDEASAIEAVGKTVKLVEGSHHNIKITQPQDLPLAQWLLSSDANNISSKPNKEEKQT